MTSPLPDVPFWRRQAAITSAVMPGSPCRLCRQCMFLWIDGTGHVWEICRRCDVGAL